MSKAERLVRQQEVTRLQVEEFERQRAMLAPKRMAAVVAAAFGYFLPLWRVHDFSHIAFDGAQRHHYPVTRSNA